MKAVIVEKHNCDENINQRIDYSTINLNYCFVSGRAKSSTRGTF